MIFHEGFVHCDPHAGNLLVRRVPPAGGGGGTGGGGEGGGVGERSSGRGGDGAKARRGRTTVLVAHRLASVRGADLV